MRADGEVDVATTTTTNEQTVRDLYAAFQRKDMAGILALVRNDVDWRNDGVESRDCPWNGNFSGKDKLAGFSKAVDGELDIKVFDIKAIVASDRHVAVELRIESVVRKTGRPLLNDAVHMWTFDDRGAIAKYRHFNDTAAEVIAWRG